MMERAILYLKEHGIEAFEMMGILVIPVKSAEHLDDIAKQIERLLRDVGYSKSWRLDPYYYERHQSVEGEMYK